MKVTVCFGSVRVLVPCGAGDLLVRDLVREATLRYKKATGQVYVSIVYMACEHLNGGYLLGEGGGDPAALPPAPRTIARSLPAASAPAQKVEPVARRTASSLFTSD
ncbi:unnamed protein product [Chilo suppressalis]|uniref:Par3/HAL N-terminal domain-containing protein n=1 Tax=Chilo suppressalis TaxID=168631 RepID=A0ABN8B9J9_CHISP|nr:unnamed protein product [Chilo suppressalis]